MKIVCLLGCFGVERDYCEHLKCKQQTQTRINVQEKMLQKIVERIIGLIDGRELE